MDLSRLDVQDAAFACCSQTSSLLDQESHDVAFVQQAQLARLRLLVIRVAKNAAIQQRAVHICYHAADVSSTVWLAVGRVCMFGTIRAAFSPKFNEYAHI